MQVGQRVVTAMRKDLQMAEQRGQASAAAMAAEVETLQLELTQTRAKRLALHGMSRPCLLSPGLSRPCSCPCPRLLDCDGASPAVTRLLMSHSRERQAQT